MNTKETCWKNGGLSPPISSLPWKDLLWKDIQIEVYKLQKQIYYSSLEKKTELLWETQKRLTHLSCAKLLAVRRVTQENRGKHKAVTYGVKNLTPVQRLHGHRHDQKTAEDTSTRARDADVGQSDEYSVIRKLTAKGALGAG